MVQLISCSAYQEFTIANFKDCISKRLNYVRQSEKNKLQSVNTRPSLFSTDSNKINQKIYEAFELDFFFWPELDGSGKELNTLQQEQLFSNIYERVKASKNISPTLEKEFIKNLHSHLEHLINKYENARLGIGHRDEKVQSYSENFKAWLNKKSVVANVQSDHIQLTPQKVIALKHVYLFKEGEGFAINNENKEKIALQYGYTSKNSGKKLYDHFIKFSGSKNNRILLSENKASNNIMLNYLESVIDLLSNYPKASQAALDEYMILKNKLK